MNGKRRMLRRITARAAMILFPVLLLGWLAWTPYVPDRVEGSIPADAHWVTWHEGLGERWPEISANPWVMEALAATGGAEVARAIAGKPLPPRIRRLTSDRVVVARALVDPRTGRTAWFGAAWTGAHGRLLRWQLKLFQPRGFHRYGQHGGRPLYRIEWPDAPAGHGLFMTFEEGLVLVCLSTDPHDLRYLLDTHDGLIPSIRSRGNIPPPAAPDRAYLRFPGSPAPAWTFLFHRLTCGETNVSLRQGEPVTTTPTPPMSPLNLPEPPWGDAPEATAVYSPALPASFPLSPDWPFIHEALSFLVTPSGQPVSLAAGLFGAPHTGRFRGMRVPGLVLAFRTEIRPEDFDGAIDRLLDRINAERQWGLIQSPDGNHPESVRRILGTASNAFSGLPRSEAPGMALNRGHVLIASNADMLARLLESEPEPARLRGSAGSKHDLALWVDLRRAASTLRLAHGVYWLVQVMERREPPPLEQAVIDAIGHRLETLDRLGEVEIRFRLGAPPFNAHIRARHPEAVTPTCTGSSI